MSQMGHSISQFILDYYELSKQWNNNYLISLSVESEFKLQKLLTKLVDIGIPLSYFTEPDIGDELTSICFLETDQTIKLTSHIPLSLSNN